MTKKDNLIDYRIEELEKNYSSLDKKVDKIMSNHLPHLEQAIIRLTTRVNVASIIQVGSALAVIGTMLAIVNGAR